MSQHFLEPKPGVASVMIGTDRYLGVFMTAFAPQEHEDEILGGTDLTPTRDLDAVLAKTATFAIVPSTLREQLENELRDPGAYMNKRFDHRPASTTNGSSA